MKAGERENILSHEYTQDDKLMHNGKVTKEEGNLTIFKRYAYEGLVWPSIVKRRSLSSVSSRQSSAVLGLPLLRKKSQEDEIRKLSSAFLKQPSGVYAV